MNKIIILSVTTIAMLTFSGCGDDAKESAKSAVEVAKEAASKTADAAKEAASAAVSKTTEAVKETATQAAESAKESVKETAAKAAEATKEAAQATVEKAKETAQAAAESVKEKASAAASAATAAATGGNEKGKAVYAKCVSCHGADGKTKALGKSEIIAGQAAADLEKKLQEYKAGTRNVAGMGMLMKGQVAPLSDEDIKAVAEYISSLK